MAISKIKGGAINDDAISTAKIQDDAVTDPKIVDSYTTSVKTNPEFQGTEAARMPVGTTAQRANAQGGDIRFNSTLSLMEYYDGTIWKAIDSPPTISTISPSTFSASGDTITVTGSNFQTGVNVTMTAGDGTTYTPDSVTRNSSSELTFDISSSIVADEADPWDVTVTNTSGLAVTSNDALTLAGTITANTAAGSLGTVYDSGRSSLTYDLGVTDSSSESDVTFSYAVTSGSVPSGLSFNTSTGALTGDANAVGSDTTSNFTITATGSDASDPDYAGTLATAYSLTIAAPVIASYTSTGAGTFSVPTGLTTVDVLVVAGGGGAGVGNGSTGGGAGGLIYRPAFPVTPGGSVSYSIGSGGTGPSNTQQGNTVRAQNGQDSTFGGLTAKGGGGGGTELATGAANPNINTHNAGAPGGSGGGSTRTGPNGYGGAGIQPQQPGDSGTYGFGNAGGGDTDVPSVHGGGAGGGAGAAGTPANTPAIVYPGGNGKQYDISGSQVYYAGGGAGTAYNGAQGTPFQPGSGGQGGGGQGGGPNPGQGVSTPNSGVANRGGGGGAGFGLFDNKQGSGGSGIVIVKY